MTAHLVLWALACVLVSVGFAGTILPILPGAPLIFGGLLLAAWIDDFQRVTWVTLTILALLTVVSLVIDFVATGLSARRVGASRLAITGAFIGTLVGIFFGLPGLILGPFAGAVAGELLSSGGIAQASRVGVATWMGFILGTVAKLGLAFAMVGIFFAAYLY